MPKAAKTETFQIGGMTCVNCERRIRDGLKKLPGVSSVTVSYSRGTARVAYDPEVAGRGDLISTIEGLHYQVNPSAQGGNGSSAAGVLLVVAALYLLLQHTGALGFFSLFPQAEAGMGYGMLFLIGLFTSVHCVAMCGGISLSQCIGAGACAGKAPALRPSLLYNLGRILSYTLIGGLVGGIGSVISFSGTARGVVQLAAGVFMVIMGLNLLGVFPGLRRLSLRLPGFFTNCIGENRPDRGPLLVGLLNGLMPCGPLQAMQLYALSTGDPLRGALSMLLFGLGTLPLMFGLGALSTVLSRRFTHRVMTAGAALVVVLGFSMLQSGLALSGLGAAQGGEAGTDAVIAENNVQLVATSLASRRYEPITVAAHVPVRWTITAAPGTVNGCNSRLIIPEYGVEKSLQVGENVIEFTPTRSGTIPYSCWMGMIRSSITIIEGDGSIAEAPAGDAPAGLPFLSQPPAAASGYRIPTDTVAVGRVEDLVQYVEIDLTDERFSPSVIVLQRGLETVWTIRNGSEAVTSLYFPLYATQLQLVDGENRVYIIPEADFDFSTFDSAFFGYVKVVEDVTDFDRDAVLRQVSEHVTYLWAPGLAG